LHLLLATSRFLFQSFFVAGNRSTSSAGFSVWRILDVIRSGAVSQRRCWTIANWTDLIAERPMSVVRPVETTKARLRRRAETMFAGARCMTSSPAELRWLVHRLTTAGYRCSTDQPPPLRHRRLAAGTHPDDELSLRLLVPTLTNVETRDARDVPEESPTNTEVQVQGTALERALQSLACLLSVKKLETTFDVLSSVFEQYRIERTKECIFKHAVDHALSEKIEMNFEVWSSVFEQGVHKDGRRHTQMQDSVLLRFLHQTCTLEGAINRAHSLDKLETGFELRS